MLVWFKMIALVLSLGMDTLVMSISLGMANTRGKLKIAFAFASAEALMPFIGLLIGKTAGQLIGHWAAFSGGILLVAVAIWFLMKEDEDEENIERRLVGWALLATALSISLDELAVGFSIGLVGVPLQLTITLIAIQAFIFTVLGLTLGSRLKSFLGEWTEKAAGIVLGVLGVWIVADVFVGLHR